MIGRLLVGGALLAVAGAAVVAIWMRGVEDDPAGWHVPLRDVQRPSASRDYLAATPGFTKARTDRNLSAADDPQALLRRLDKIARSDLRTHRLAGSPEEGRITWVQRSSVFGFPDYITVEARPDGWAIWSRARFGRSDFGVNRRRVQRWLAAAD